jgi:hypothetical protein
MVAYVAKPAVVSARSESPAASQQQREVTGCGDRQDGQRPSELTVDYQTHDQTNKNEMELKVH